MDLIVEAFQNLDERLIVAGDGEHRETLERMAAGYDNIEIRGFVEDIESLVANATAVVYAPTQEDFGLVGAEALTAGKPLIGVNEGFTRYQVKQGTTGISFEPSVESLISAIRSFDPAEFNADEIQATAEQYSYEQFKSRLQAVVNKNE
jgi:glycosyltransferase involved in cell wall biosynthesis